MTVAASLALWLLAAAPAEQAVSESRAIDVRNLINNAAFEPSKYFADEEVGLDLIYITYRGDDYDWPFYSIAIRNDCAKVHTEACQLARRARMVKVPVGANERPRKSGSRLVGEILQQATTPQDIPKALDKSGLQWVEADLKACPGAMSVLAEATKSQWVQKTTVAPAKGDPIRLSLHADKVTVAFKEYLQEATYYGALYEGTPAAWADNLAKTLEPCWKPASAPAPWHQ